MKRLDGPYLPECNCKTRTEDEWCPIHAPGGRAAESRRALKAIKKGTLSADTYYAWLKKYRKEVPRPFGSIR